MALTNYYFVLTNHYLVMTTYCLVLTNYYLVLTNDWRLAGGIQSPPAPVSTWRAFGNEESRQLEVRTSFYLVAPMPPTPVRNPDFGSNMGLLGSGRDLKRRGASVGSIWAEFQFKRSHGDPCHAQTNNLCGTGYESGALVC